MKLDTFRPLNALAKYQFPFEKEKRLDAAFALHDTMTKNLSLFLRNAKLASISRISGVNVETLRFIRDGKHKNVELATFLRIASALMHPIWTYFIDVQKNEKSMRVKNKKINLRKNIDDVYI